MTASTMCPYCATATPFARQLDPELPGVSLDELEVLVRNEWRGRLGWESYRRVHPRGLVRAVAVLALQPSSPVREIVVEELVGKEVARWQADGLSPAGVRRELTALVEALGRQLRMTWGDTARTRHAMARVEAALFG